MNVLMPLGLSELVICGAHGVETILVDQDMNRVNPGTASSSDAEHCGLCTLVFGVAWVSVPSQSLAPPIIYISSHRDDVRQPGHPAFALALSRAPPRFS